MSDKTSSPQTGSAKATSQTGAPSNSAIKTSDKPSTMTSSSSQTEPIKAASQTGAPSSSATKTSDKPSAETGSTKAAESTKAIEPTKVTSQTGAPSSSAIKTSDKPSAKPTGSDKPALLTGSPSVVTPATGPSDGPSVAPSTTPSTKAPPAFGQSDFSFGAGFEAFAKPANSPSPAPGAKPAPLFAAPSEPSVSRAEFEEMKTMLVIQQAAYEEKDKRAIEQATQREQQTTSRIHGLELEIRSVKKDVADKDRRIDVQNKVIKTLKDQVSDLENGKKESEDLLAALTDAPADDQHKTEKQWRSEVYKLRHQGKEQKKAAAELAARVSAAEAAEKTATTALEERKAAGDSGAKNIRKSLKAEFDAKLDKIELEHAGQLDKLVQDNRDEVAVLKGHLSQKETDAQVLLGAYKSTILDLRAANGELQDDLLAREASLSASKSRDDQSQEELSAALDEIDVLREKVRCLEGEAAASVQASKADGIKIGHLQTDLTRADEALAAIKAKEGEQVAAVAAAEQRGRDKAALQFREELQNKAADVDRVEAELEGLSSAHSKATAECAVLQARLDQALREYDENAAAHMDCVGMADVELIKREVDELNAVLEKDAEEKLRLQNRIVDLEEEAERRQAEGGGQLDLAEELGGSEEEEDEDEPLVGSDREGEAAPEEEVEDGPGAQAAVAPGEGASPAGWSGSLAVRLSWGGSGLLLVAMVSAFAFLLAALVLSGSGSSMLGSGMGQFGWDGERPGVGGVALRALGGILSKAQADGVARSLWSMGWAGGQAWGGGL